MRIQRNFLIFCGLCLLVAGTVSAAPMRPTRAPHAMVASVHELASQAGVEVLRSGGNAVDAAVATGFALAVVYPQAGNLGGGGFLLLRNANGKVHFIDFREKAPAAATENMYLDAQGQRPSGGQQRIQPRRIQVHRRPRHGRWSGLCGKTIRQAVD
jgi:gamma-glutamyltranspeptidase / glutathione hydrolase